MMSIHGGRELSAIEKITDVLASTNWPLTKDAIFIPIFWQARVVHLASSCNLFHQSVLALVFMTPDFQIKHNRHILPYLPLTQERLYPTMPSSKSEFLSKVSSRETGRSWIHSINWTFDRNQEVLWEYVIRQLISEIEFWHLPQWTGGNCLWTKSKLLLPVLVTVKGDVGSKTIYP